MKKYSFDDHPENKEQLKPWADRWIDHILNTNPLTDSEKEEVVDAVNGLYEAAGLRPPKNIVFAPSPMVTVFSGCYAAQALREDTGKATWDAARKATRDVTREATEVATEFATEFATWDATRDAAEEATRNATAVATRKATAEATVNTTREATWDATWDATANATRDATRDATVNATRDATVNATAEASSNNFFLGDEGCKAFGAATGFSLSSLHETRGYLYSGGNFAAHYDSFISFFRHIAKIDIDYSKYQHWETLARLTGPRMVHKDFCIISDRPVFIKMDENNRPHAEDGPYIKWRDGSCFYAWHGTYIPWWWIESKERLTPEVALKWDNLEQRRVACEILGWHVILRELDAITINKDDDPQIGELVEVVIPDVGKERFLRVLCGTGREFALPVPPEVRTALEANAWTYGIDADFYKPEVRT